MANIQIDIKSNGTTTLATAGKICDRNIDVKVAVPASGITPNGTKNITTNGSHDVTAYANAQVNVPIPDGYIKPSGTKSITTNGTHDVTSFASALVNVPSSAKTLYTIPITLDAAQGGGANANKVLLSGHDFVKEHYADEGFFAVWIPVNATTAVDSGVVGMVFHANRALITTKNTIYGIFLRSTGTTASPNFLANTAKLNGNGYNVSLRANSSGNINLYVASAYTVPAGEYLLVLGLMSD